MEKNIVQKLLFSLLAIVVIVCAVEIYFYYGILFPETEDAYIHADIVNVASKVNGQVMEVLVHQGQTIQKGELLFRVDPKPYLLAKEAASAQVELAQQKIAATEAGLLAFETEVERMKVEEQLAEEVAKRATRLANDKDIPKSQLETATTKLNAARLGVKSAEQHLQQARAAAGKLGKENAALKAAEAQLKLDEFNLENTEYHAPLNGVIANFNLSSGELVAVGNPLFAIIDTAHYWVNANYKETQISRIHVGQKATVDLDMYPDEEREGRVEEISPGTQGSFSLLPSQNSTGNWVKVSQRFTVRIHLQENKNYPLRLGASCHVKINTLSE